MPMLTLLDGQLAYGDHPLLDRAAFSLESGERIGLIGGTARGNPPSSPSSPAARRWTTGN